MDSAGIGRDHYRCLSCSSAQIELDEVGQAGVCRVVVAYEDVPSRNSAIHLCDRVFQTFNGDLDFQADWWAFRYLGSRELGEQAAGAAANSDLVIVSTDSGGEFPLDIKHWFERWLSKLSNRKQREAALVSLVPPAAAGNPGGAKEDYLRTVARQAKLDYLSIGASTAAALSNDTAAHRYHIPDWGINE